ncbi:hypothetical protein AMECASPLE_008549 [Ameca splendens]|uniref:Uncharacterized protein n=1 Tax=Ameca splendens TaxID=208324 RepID=A0ABV0ZK00_9TELE
MCDTLHHCGPRVILLQANAAGPMVAQTTLKLGSKLTIDQLVRAVATLFGRSEAQQQRVDFNPPTLSFCKRGYRHLINSVAAFKNLFGRILDLFGFLFFTQ